jgi:hypothetical protein
LLHLRHIPFYPQHLLIFYSRTHEDSGPWPILLISVPLEWLLQVRIPPMIPQKLFKIFKTRHECGQLLLSLDLLFPQPPAISFSLQSQEILIARHRLTAYWVYFTQSSTQDCKALRNRLRSSRDLEANVNS